MSGKNFFRIKEFAFKWLFVFQDKTKKMLRTAALVSDVVLFFSGLFFIILLITRLGFSKEETIFSEYRPIIQFLFLISYVSKYVQELIRFFSKKNWARWLEVFLFFLFTSVLLANWLPGNHMFKIPLLTSTRSIAFALALIYISEGYKLFRIINSVKIAPSLLFAMSFILMIMAGSGLLLLPNAHIGSLSYIDSIFTSASAVCVTGLVTVDTATVFTQNGHIIIMLLIQVGGLGIMAFTGFFAYAFTGTVSLKDRLLLKDIFSSDTLSDIFKLLLKIILLTLLIESIGAFLIYLSLTPSMEHRLFFSVFHSISAFCNAGFSILPNGLANEAIKNNRLFILTISMLIILGGIGFPVLIGLYAAIRSGLIKRFPVFFFSKKPLKPFKNNLANQISLTTTLVLLISGMLLYYYTELKNTLSTEDEISRWIISFFGSVSARTAGFNIMDLSKWNYATVFIITFLMWIGASPGSTGGGIKTTTFAVSLLVMYNFIRGRHKVEIGFRYIGSETISRVLTVLILSIIIISSGFMALVLLEPDHNPIYLLFEIVSAFSTVGLSIAGTPSFGYAAKWVLIIMMFVGRVGPLPLLSGIFVTNQHRYYRLPEQDLTIN